MQKRKYKLIINRFAREDIDIAIDYYENIRVGLGNEFWIETKSKMEDIEKNPFLFQIIEDETRRAILNRFPFGIFFIIKDYSVNVFGIIHFSRSPIMWLKRTESQGKQE